MRLRHPVAAAAALVITLIFPAAAAAHVHLVAATPADGANVDEPPTEVVITFDGELDPDRSEFIVSDASGAAVGTGKVDLDVADRNVLRADVEISEPGVYVVSWTAAGTDGHEVTGEIRFGYAADVVAAPDEQPNTAVSSPSAASAALVAGVAALLVAGAAALGAGRAGRSTARAARR